MQVKWGAAIVFCCIYLGGLSGLAKAENSQPSTATTRLQVQADDMQTQLTMLKQQIAELESQQRALVKANQQANSTSQNADLPSTKDNVSAEAPPAAIITGKEKLLELAEHRLYNHLSYGRTLLGNIGGTAVITSPFIHSRYDFRGSGLIVNYSSINKDASSLAQRRSFFNQMKSMGYDMPAYPILELSGEVAGQFRQYRLFSGRHGNTLELSDAELDMQALVNDWFLGFMSFAYDATPTTSGNRTFNSNLYLDNGFVTLGDFNKIPYYGTIGQFYVPFGQFDSYLITDPINKTLFRTKARAVTLGYQSLSTEGPFAAIYAFRGPTRIGDYEPNATSRNPSAYINTFGINAGYNYSIGALSGLIGGSLISNVADSLGMQETGGADFGGFAASSATQVLRHRVPGYDLRLEIYYTPFAFIGEYSGSMRSFSPLDISFNGHGAKPGAYHLEAVYNFDFFMRPSNLALGYGHSFQSLALNVPAQRASIAFNTVFWKNTLASLEYRHETNYACSDYASGSNGAIFSPLGQIQNTLTAQFDIYF